MINRVSQTTVKVWARTSAGFVTVAVFAPTALNTLSCLNESSAMFAVAFPVPYAAHWSIFRRVRTSLNSDDQLALVDFSIGPGNLSPQREQDPLLCFDGDLYEYRK